MHIERSCRSMTPAHFHLALGTCCPRANCFENNHNLRHVLPLVTSCVRAKGDGFSSQTITTLFAMRSSVTGMTAMAAVLFMGLVSVAVAAAVSSGPPTPPLPYTTTMLRTHHYSHAEYLSIAEKLSVGHTGWLYYFLRQSLTLLLWLCREGPQSCWWLRTGLQYCDRP